MTFWPWHAFIGKNVLQFDGCVHSDWLKAVARLPVPQDNTRTDPVRVENLLPRLLPRRAGWFPTFNVPSDAHAVHHHLPCSVQLDLFGACVELGPLRLPQA